MADTFDVSYIIRAVDRVTETNKQIVRSLDRLDDKVKRTAQKASSRFKQIENSAKRFKSTINGVARESAVKITAPVVALVGTFIKAASDAEETTDKFNVVFESIRESADNTAKNLSDNFGLSIVKSKELLGATGDLLTGFGFAETEALGLSEKVNKLAVDLAAFNNLEGGAERASQALTKALLGERESIKSLGISIQEEDVKRKISLMRSQGMTFATKRQARAVATLELAMKQSTKAQGNFAETSHTLAGQTKILAARTNDFNVAFGKVLIPDAVRAVKVLQDLLTRFANLSENTRRNILVIGLLAAALAPLLIALSLVTTSIMFLTKSIIFFGGIVKGLPLLLGLLTKGLLLARNAFVAIRVAMFALNPAMAIVTGLLTLGSIAFFAFKDDIVEAVTRAFDFVTEKFTKIKDFLASLNPFAEKNKKAVEDTVKEIETKVIVNKEIVNKTPILEDDEITQLINRNLNNNFMLDKLGINQATVAPPNISIPTMNNNMTSNVVIEIQDKAGVQVNTNSRTDAPQQNVKVNRGTNALAT